MAACTPSSESNSIFIRHLNVLHPSVLTNGSHGKSRDRGPPWYWRTPGPQDNDGDDEVIIGCGQPHIGGSGLPCDINKSEDDCGSESDDGNKSQVSGDPPGGQHRPRKPRDGHALVKSQRPMGPEVPVFMNLHVKCPVFLEKDDKDSRITYCTAMTGLTHKGLQKKQNVIGFA